MRTWIITFLLIFFVIIPCFVMAQGTPDWQTPNTESVCDDEAGAAYGLCNAYCEAMDCDCETPHASETACTKVSDKFTQITGRNMPCDEYGQVDCLCLFDEEFSNFLANPDNLASCIDNMDGFMINNSDNTVSVAANDSICAYIDKTDPTDIIYISRLVTPDQAILCLDLLHGKVPGMTCGD